MKKALLVILCAALVFALAACSAKKQNEATTATSETTSAVTQEATAPKVNYEPVTNEDGDILITMPSDFYDEYNPPSDALTEDQKEKGVKAAIVNDDSTLTYVIDKDKYEELKKLMYKETGDALNNYKQSQPYVKNVACKSDFSVINLQVDREEYSSQMGNFVIIWEAGLNGELYQVFAGVPPEDLSVDVVLSDYETGEVIDAAHYPNNN